ncbi:helix-turn-helix transcriptional regulator [Anaerocolumna sp. AGMB13025]|uniref:helix-turn-helix domain-containing protein n=1 Tax=Anaerocolumna sp. AGMB13025 TaxID=3039116 RepID=UPI00241ECDBE|nr:helix-turn-helix transcriptional regulator [Anaerocolumna sp. AGMB13025]WFR56838.1 helix-turn-helix transcriptional regulator [Anaerocolumna sp. AGMB13025]
MSLGSNICFLRKQKKYTQEQFAEKMGVTRQTISRWESGEVVPELAKLIEICDVFTCKLDALVKENLSDQGDIYSKVQIKRVAAFRMARYVMISPNPESDVNEYMEKWAISSGLKASNPNARRIGWDFPFVSQEQQNRFGMHGYVSAYILPEGFDTKCPGVVEYAENAEADYAMITIKEPFIQPFERIPNAYKIIMEYLQVNNFKEKQQDNIVSCFEHEYEENGIEYMEVYIHVEGVTKVDAFSPFN